MLTGSKDLLLSLNDTVMYMNSLASFFLAILKRLVAKEKTRNLNCKSLVCFSSWQRKEDESLYSLTPTQRTDISLFLCLVTAHNLSEYLSFGNGQELKSYHLTWQKDKMILNRGARERILNRQPSFQQLQWGRYRGRNVLHKTLSWHSGPRTICRIKQQCNEDQLPAVRIHRVVETCLKKITSRRDLKRGQFIPTPISS